MKDLYSPPDGCNSVHAVPKSVQPNSDFINDEYVVYLLNQVRLDYLIQFQLTSESK